ncbi:MAG: hypothetical protein QOH61_2119 [Chloroflexota bacterium]|jgi:hypothetical protein|nr:hypothetical protein [Chloroflexota bacterium]
MSRSGAVAIPVETPSEGPIGSNATTIGPTASPGSWRLGIHGRPVAVMTGEPAPAAPAPAAPAAQGAKRALRTASTRTEDYRRRALALWPRLDPGKLRRTRGEAARIARLVERRTALPFEMILGMLTRGD